MTTTRVPMDGGAMDPKLARILLRYREAVARATERACRDLERLGVKAAISRS